MRNGVIGDVGTTPLPALASHITPTPEGLGPMTDLYGSGPAAVRALNSQWNKIELWLLDGTLSFDGVQSMMRNQTGLIEQNLVMKLPLLLHTNTGLLVGDPLSQQLLIGLNGD